jgi:hypothetical protein
MKEFVNSRENTWNQLLKEFEKMEESKQLLTEVIEQKSNFSANNSIEIQVTQLVKAEHSVK